MPEVGPRELATRLHLRQFFPTFPRGMGRFLAGFVTAEDRPCRSTAPLLAGLPPLFHLPASRGSDERWESAGG